MSNTSLPPILCQRCNHSIELGMLLLLPESKHCIHCARVIQKLKSFKQAATGPYRGDLPPSPGRR